MDGDVRVAPGSSRLCWVAAGRRTPKVGVPYDVRYRLACDLCAGSVRRDLEALARSARVSLAARPQSAAAPVALPGLTTREHEILGVPRRWFNLCGDRQHPGDQ